MDGSDGKPEGRPQLDCSDVTVRQQVLDSALKRANASLQKQLESSSDLAIPLASQVGGLSNGKKAPIMSIPPHYVLKPVQLKQNRGFREVAFYESLQLAHIDSKTLDETIAQPDLKNDVLTRINDSRRNEIDLLKSLSQFTASYYGVIQLRLPTNDSAQQSSLPPQPLHYIVLRDLTMSTSSNVMDLKMGTQTFEPDAALEKKQREASKYQQQSEFGFRLVGMSRYYHGDSGKLGQLKTWDKLHGRTLTSRATLLDTFGKFFAVSSSNSERATKTQPVLCTDIIISIQSQIQSLQEWFQKNDVLTFYSSSILLVFDENSASKADMCMVDFGHVRRNQGGDDGYQLGLLTLSSILDELLQ